MKKLIALLLVAAFVTISAVGCGDSKPTSTGGGKAADTGKKTP